MTEPPDNPSQSQDEHPPKLFAPSVAASLLLDLPVLLAGLWMVLAYAGTRPARALAEVSGYTFLTLALLGVVGLLAYLHLRKQRYYPGRARMVYGWSGCISLGCYLLGLNGLTHPLQRWAVLLPGILLGAYRGGAVASMAVRNPRHARWVLLAAALLGGGAIFLGCGWAFARDGLGSTAGWLGLWLGVWLAGRSASFVAQLEKRRDETSRLLAAHHMLRGAMLLQGAFLTVLAPEPVLAALCFAVFFVLFPLSGLLDRRWQQRLLAETALPVGLPSGEDHPASFP